MSVGVSTCKILLNVVQYRHERLRLRRYYIQRQQYVQIFYFLHVATAVFDIVYACAIVGGVFARIAHFEQKPLPAPDFVVRSPRATRGKICLKVLG